MFLKLTRFGDNKIIYVNFDSVSHFIKEDDDCTILIYVDGFICIKETPEEIFGMLNDKS